MKKVLLSSVVFALLTLTGCSDKGAAIDATNPNATNSNDTNSNAVDNSEVVSSDDAVVTDESLNSNNDVLSSNDDMSMGGLENKMQSVFFSFDKFNLDSGMQTKVQGNAELAKGAASTYILKLEGNCDEWGSDEYNFALGLKRAKAVKNEMIANGVDAKRITMVSYGESNPTCSDKTQACWAQNRRVDVKLLP